MTTGTDAILARMHSIKADAKFFVNRRRKDVELYGILAECLSICEQIEAEDRLAEFKSMLLTKPLNGRNRSYVEKDSDVCLVVGRYIFEPELNREACWRYTVVMREAMARQIKSHQLVDYMRKSGGIHSLFQNRDRERVSRGVKTLYLDRQIECSVGETVSLSLMRKNDGSFTVLGAQ